MDRQVAERTDLPPCHFRVAVPEFVGQCAGDLAEQQHPVQYGVTQDVFGVSALPGHAVQVPADRSCVVDEVGEHLIADHPVQPVLSMTSTGIPSGNFTFAS